MFITATCVCFMTFKFCAIDSLVYFAPFCFPVWLLIFYSFILLFKQHQTSQTVGPLCVWTLKWKKLVQRLKINTIEINMWLLLCERDMCLESDIIGLIFFAFDVFLTYQNTIFLHRKIIIRTNHWLDYSYRFYFLLI